LGHAPGEVGCRMARVGDGGCDKNHVGAGNR
jgi:hypothetical protein